MIRQTSLTLSRYRFAVRPRWFAMIESRDKDHSTFGVCMC